jgi:hypothetical protein
MRVIINGAGESIVNAVIAWSSFGSSSPQCGRAINVCVAVLNAMLYRQFTIV